MFLSRGELMLNSPISGGDRHLHASRGRLSSIDTTTSTTTNATSAPTTTTASVTGSSHLNEEDLGKFRTKFCERKIIYGYCDHGGGWGCNFSHNLKWLRRNAQKQKYAPRMCANFPCCVNGMSCQYAHSREEQFFHPSVYKRLPCLAYPHGCCRLGQLCPFTHGISDHFLATSELSAEDFYQLVDQQTSVILHTLNLTAEKLVLAVNELENEHDPGVRFPSSSSEFAGRGRGGSLLDMLSEIATEKAGEESGVFSAGEGYPTCDRFISLLKGERGGFVCGGLSLWRRDENSRCPPPPGAASGVDVLPQTGGGAGGSSCTWKSICKDIEISVSSGKVGVYLGGACVAFQGRMECASMDGVCSSGGSYFPGAFVLEDKSASMRECLVVRCPVRPPAVLGGGGGLVNPVRVDTDAKNGWVGIFEIDGRRTLVDWLKLEKKLSGYTREQLVGAGGAGGGGGGGFCLLEDCEGNLGTSFDGNSGSSSRVLGEYLVAMKEDRDLLVRQFIMQMLRILQTVHEAGKTLGGFTLDQWQFVQGSVEKLVLLPVHLQSQQNQEKSNISSSSNNSGVADIRSLGLVVCQLLLGVEGVGAGGGEKMVGSVAEQKGGLAWDFVVRCLYYGQGETKESIYCGDLLRHPYLWSWSTMGSVLMRGVSTWFQQSGLLFKPNAQRHLINWAENSFGCTRNEGVPVRRQVFRLAATLDWVPSKEAGGECANVVASMSVGDKRASPCLVLEQGKVNLVKGPMNGSGRMRGGNGLNLLEMLPVCSSDSHLELVLPHGSLKGGSPHYGKVVEGLLSRFHLTERTSVYSFLSFVLFALANPHLCMDGEVVSRNSQAALIRRHRAVVMGIINAVPLGMLMTCQLAEADNLLDSLQLGNINGGGAGGFNSPKRVRSPTTLLLDGRFLS